MPIPPPPPLAAVAALAEHSILPGPVAHFQLLVSRACAPPEDCTNTATALIVAGVVTAVLLVVGLGAHGVQYLRRKRKRGLLIDGSSSLVGTRGEEKKMGGDSSIDAGGDSAATPAMITTAMAPRINISGDEGNDDDEYDETKMQRNGSSSNTNTNSNPKPGGIGGSMWVLEQEARRPRVELMSQRQFEKSPAV